VPWRSGRPGAAEGQETECREGQETECRGGQEDRERPEVRKTGSGRRSGRPGAAGGQEDRERPEVRRPGAAGGQASLRAQRGKSST